MMGGLGSGRWFRSRERLTTEDLPRIDIRAMKRQGVLHPNYPGVFSWTIDDPLVGSMSFKIHRGWLSVEYFTTINGQKTKNTEDIKFDSTPCHFGGSRYWFLCPCCKTRITTVYKLNNVYRCRHCHNLTFRSQSESELDRVIRKSRKLRQQLGGPENLYEHIKQKPKGMHYSTFKRLAKEERAASLTAENAIDEKIFLFESMGWFE